MSARPVLSGADVTVGTDTYTFRDHGAAVVALKSLTVAHDAGHDIFPCGWLVEQYGHAGVCEPDDEFGICGGCEMAAEGPRVVECGAPAVGTDRGWSCHAGHSYVTMEARHDEGWDYFDDDEIAAAYDGDFLPLVGMVRMSGVPA